MTIPFKSAQLNIPSIAISLYPHPTLPRTSIERLDEMRRGELRFQGRENDLRFPKASTSAS